MGKDEPAWLQGARQFCRDSGIEIMMWGPDSLVVEAKSEDRAKIASQLGHLGFKVIENEDDAYAGMLTVSLNPAAFRAKILSFDISHRRWDEQIVPLLWSLGFLLLVPNLFGNATRTPYWARVAIGLFCVIMFFRDGTRIWGWQLELLHEGLHVRRYFRWTMIPWRQIQAVNTAAAFSRNQKEVVLKLKSAPAERLGSFNDAFACNLRERLRAEIAQRQGEGG